jgi:hypothetical protein
MVISAADADGALLDASPGLAGGAGSGRDALPAV